MESNVDNVRAQMRKGVLEYCILCILAKREAYASAIIEELKAADMIVVDGTHKIKAGDKPALKEKKR